MMWKNQLYPYATVLENIIDFYSSWSGHLENTKLSSKKVFFRKHKYFSTPNRRLEPVVQWDPHSVISVTERCWFISSERCLEGLKYVISPTLSLQKRRVITSQYNFCECLFFALFVGSTSMRSQRKANGQREIMLKVNPSWQLSSSSLHGWQWVFMRHCF